MSDSASKLTIPKIQDLRDDDDPAFANTLPEPESSEPPPPIRVDMYVGSTFDNRYVIDEPLREGGMGLVYKGTHKGIGKAVAIKVLREDMVSDPEMLKRFRNEARAVSLIESPHIIDITDYGILPDGARYYVMELLEGESLGDLLARTGPMHFAKLIHIAKQIAMGLGAAHKAGIIHRDLKPDNVMIIRFGQEETFVKVLDFGIAKVASDSQKLTKTGAVFGTPLYMSPEQAAGIELDQRTDIYALGVIMFEMAAGRVPFNAENVMAILSQHMYKAPPSLRSLVEDIPEALEAIIVRLLAKKPESRYGSMDELVADLDQVAKGLAPESTARVLAQSGELSSPADYFGGRAPAQTASPVTTISMRPPPRPKWHAAVALLMAAGAIGGSVALVSRVTKPESARVTPTVEPDPLPPSFSTAPAKAEPAASTDIRLLLVPPTAKVSVNGKLFPSRTVTVAKDEKVSLVVEAPGYQTKTVEMSSKDSPEITVSLVASAKSGTGLAPIAKPPSPPAAASPVGAKRKCSDGEVPAYDNCIK